MDKFLEHAGELQRGVKHDEIEQLSSGLNDYSEEQSRQAAVHTRQDMVMVVSLLLDLNRQVRRLTWLAVVALAVAVFFLTRSS